MSQRDSLARKITWMNVAVSAAALLIAATALLIYDQASYKEILLDNISAQSDVVGRNSVSALIFADPQSATETLSALERVPNIMAASLFTPDGKLFASYARDGKVKIEGIPPGANPATES